MPKEDSHLQNKIRLSGIVPSGADSLIGRSAVQVPRILWPRYAMSWLYTTRPLDGITVDG